MSKKDVGEWLLSHNRFEFPRKAKTICVTSGKGGVGKTSLAIKLCQTLSKRKLKVLLLDCDYNLANTSVKLGLPLNNNFYSFIKGEKIFEECIVKIFDFDLLSGCNGDLDVLEFRELEVSKIIMDILLTRESDYDYIVLDCPAGLSKDVLSLNAYTDYRLFIVTADKSSITDSYSLMKILDAKYGVHENHILINKVSGIEQYKKMEKILTETLTNFTESLPHFIGFVPFQNLSAVEFDNKFLREENFDLDFVLSQILEKFSEKTGKVQTGTNNLSQGKRSSSCHLSENN